MCSFSISCNITFWWKMLKVVQKIWTTSEIKLMFCVLAQTPDFMPIKIDYLGNNQIHILTNGHEFMKSTLFHYIFTFLLDLLHISRTQYFTYLTPKQVQII